MHSRYIIKNHDAILSFYDILHIYFIVFFLSLVLLPIYIG